MTPLPPPISAEQRLWKSMWDLSTRWQQHHFNSGKRPQLNNPVCVQVAQRLRRGSPTHRGTHPHQKCAHIKTGSWARPLKELSPITSQTFTLRNTKAAERGWVGGWVGSWDILWGDRMTFSMSCLLFVHVSVAWGHRWSPVQRVVED